MRRRPPTFWLIAGAAGLLVVVVVAALVVMLVARERELAARTAIRKQSMFAMLDLTADMDAAAVAMHAFNADGGLDLTGLEDPPALDRRIELAAKAQSAAEQVLVRGEALPDRLGDALKNLPPARVDEAKQQLAQKVNWPQGRHIFRTQADVHAAVGNHLRFLKQHHGHWRVDPVGLRVDWRSEQQQAAEPADRKSVV